MPIKYDEKVKRPNEKCDLTPTQEEEIKRCWLDITYFAQTYWKRKDPIHGIQRIILYDHQKKYLNDLVSKKRNIVVKSRQLGITTANAIYALWYSFFHNDKVVAYSSVKQSMTFHVNEQIKVAYEHIPYFLKPGVKEYNRSCIEFENGTAILFRHIGPDSFRGLCYSTLIIDSFAFVKENVAEEFWSSHYPVASLGGNIVISSCPNGTDNKFYELVSNEDWNVNRFPWHCEPSRDEKWAQKMKSELSLETWLKEYQCEFI